MGSRLRQQPGKERGACVRWKALQASRGSPVTGPSNIAQSVRLRDGASTRSEHKNPLLTMLPRLGATAARHGCRLLHSTKPRMGLLKLIPPVLGPDLLKVLRAAGHGDKIAIVDCNFPAAEVASKTVSGVHVDLAGVDLPEAVDAICTLFPLDYFIDCPAEYMVPSPGNETPPLATEVHDQLKEAVGKHADVNVAGLERFAFYEAARESFAVVQCGGERRPYGNVILTKGVVGPDGNDLKP